MIIHFEALCCLHDVTLALLVTARPSALCYCDNVSDVNRLMRGHWVQVRLSEADTEGPPLAGVLALVSLTRPLLRLRTLRPAEARPSQPGEERETTVTQTGPSPPGGSGAYRGLIRCHLVRT